MRVPLEDLVLEDRSRDDMGDIQSLGRSIARNGQFNDIIIEKKDDGKYKVLQGGRRFTAMSWLKTMKSLGIDDDLITDLESSGVDPAFINAKLWEDLNEVEAFVLEFEENNKRLDPTWQEQARLVRKVHDAAKKAEKDWKQKDTARILNLNEGTVSEYLTLTEDHPAVDAEVLAERSSKVAKKKLKIKKAKLRKEEAVKKQEEREEKVEKTDFDSVADKVLYLGDAREWLAGIPNGALHWFHWDPPYGGSEGEGGAFAAHEGIDTDLDYCLSLMEDIIPEIHRVLHDGAWLAIWFTPAHYEWLRMYLQGHRFNEDGVCEHCKKNRNVRKDYIFLSQSYSCRKSPFRFWVNPYPNIWRKTDRHADGHEIQRFLTKETEFFLYAGKDVIQTPILLRSDHGNVFDFPLPVDRRHVNHKNEDLLIEILRDISVPGSIGGDAGVGGGSIIDAAFDADRKVTGAELREGYHKISRELLLGKLKEKNLGTESKILHWL